MSEPLTQSATTVRRLTANAAAAIATIAVEGPAAARLLHGMLLAQSGKPLSLESACARFALWNFANTDLANEHVVVLVRSPHCIEVHCHGGVVVTDQIIRQLRDAGAMLAEETCVSSTGSQSSDESIKLAVQPLLISAPTLKSACIWLDQYQGTLAKEFNVLRGHIQHERYAQAVSLCDDLLERAEFGKRLRQAWRLTLAGPPNTGKSSLMNALCGSNRVLVHHEPGTTRDAVDTDLVIGGWPLVLTDTAGIRDARDSIERQGVHIAQTRWQRADIGLLVVDAEVGWTDEHTQLLVGSPTLFVVINKVDLVEDDRIRTLVKLVEYRIGGVRSRPEIILASTRAEPGVSRIVDRIGGHLDRLRPPSGSGIPFSEQQLAWLQSLRITAEAGQRSNHRGTERL